MSTDPTTIAREVLDLAHEDETVTVCSIPDSKAAALARAVLAVAALADKLEDQGHRGLDSKALANVTAGMAEVAAADRIRAALNGDNA